MTKRTTTQSLVILRYLVRRPLLAVTMVFAFAWFSLSVAFYGFECAYGPPYNTYLGAVRGILVLIISGFDVQPPKSAGALMCSYLLMITGIMYIALVTAIVTTKLVGNKLTRGLAMGTIRFERHILLCGWANRSREILDQLFAPDLKEHTPVVIIDPDIEEAPLDHPLLRTIRGDPTKTAVLKAANAAKARAAIILANRDGADVDAADARSLLIALAIETLQPEIYSCVEVLNPDNVVHFRRVNVDEVISVSDISNHLVVQAALNPGVSTLISDMLTFGEGDELYLVPVPPAFVGRTFADLTSVLIHEYDMVLVGVCSDGEIVTSHRSRWCFREGDSVFVLAEDEPRGLESAQPK